MIIRKACLIRSNMFMAIIYPEGCICVRMNTSGCIFKYIHVRLSTWVCRSTLLAQAKQARRQIKRPCCCSRASPKCALCDNYLLFTFFAYIEKEKASFLTFTYPFVSKSLTCFLSCFSLIAIYPSLFSFFVQKWSWH